MVAPLPFQQQHHQKMTRMKHRTLQVGWLWPLFFLVVTLFSTTEKKDDQIKYIYLVRHAEKDLTDTTDNPALTPAGESRAQRLVSEFESIHLDQIFSTSYQRNMNTVAPLAKEKNLTIENYAWKEYECLIKKLKEGDNQSILICGHGDNLIPMIELLGGKSPLKSLGPNEYDKLFKITYHPQKTKVKIWSY